MAAEIAGPALTGFELMADRPLDFVMRHIPGAIRPLSGPHEWHVLMEISSGRSAEDARSLMEEVLAGAWEAGHVADAAIAANIAQAQAFWSLRETMSEAQKPEGGSIKHDISVPVAAIPDFIRRADATVEATVPGARPVCFGHMGDGNLHYNVSQPMGADSATFIARYGDVNRAVHAVVRALDGSISAEHGIGRVKRAELLETAPPVGIDLMRRIKAAFDPAGIMNPGKVI
jgi:FAD/FMN-containing dehydrogenase